MSHTPGPWVLMDIPEPSRSDHGWRAIVIIGKRMVGVRKEQMWRGRENRSALGSGAERDANARLIAAAPDLLQALKECIDKACSTPGEWVPLDTMRKMQSAISKSERAETPVPRKTENAE